jgi:hypothetical protein
MLAITSITFEMAFLPSVAVSDIEIHVTFTYIVSAMS